MYIASLFYLELGKKINPEIVIKLVLTFWAQK